MRFFKSKMHGDALNKMSEKDAAALLTDSTVASTTVRADTSQADSDPRWTVLCSSRNFSVWSFIDC